MKAPASMKPLLDFFSLNVDKTELLIDLTDALPFTFLPDHVMYRISDGDTVVTVDVKRKLEVCEMFRLTPTDIKKIKQCVKEIRKYNKDRPFLLDRALSELERRKKKKK